MKAASGKFYLFKTEAGNSTQHDYVSGLSLAQDTWYEVEIDWGTDGTQIATLYTHGGTQLARISMSDTEWSGGGIGYDAYPSSGTSAHFDYVSIDKATQLGAFEEGYDGWSATGSNSLSRVDGSQQPAVVTEGNHALDVTVNSDPEPAIENQQLVQNADFENNPCLLADVLPINVENSSSPVTFRFRYHHSNGVEESHEMTVDQQYGGRICWDMSGLSTTKLANPDRLEIVWYPRDHPPGSGFDYDGEICIDNVHLTDDHNKATNAIKFRKQRELERKYGLMIDQVIQSHSDGSQDGVYKYSDGTEVSYTIKKFQNGDVEETVDGETFRWTGGSA